MLTPPWPRLGYNLTCRRLDRWFLQSPLFSTGVYPQHLHHLHEAFHYLEIRTIQTFQIQLFGLTRD
jgi:hypothetical protein